MKSLKTRKTCLVVKVHQSQHLVAIFVIHRVYELSKINEWGFPVEVTTNPFLGHPQNGTYNHQTQKCDKNKSIAHFVENTLPAESAIHNWMSDFEWFHQTEPNNIHRLT